MGAASKQMRHRTVPAPEAPRAALQQPCEASPGAPCQRKQKAKELTQAELEGEAKRAANGVYNFQGAIRGSILCWKKRVMHSLLS